MLKILSPFIEGGIWLIAWTYPKKERQSVHSKEGPE